MATLWAPATWRAVGVSLSLAVPAALLSVALGLAFAVGARAAMERPGWAWLPQQLEQLGNWILVMPALVLATGLFLLLRDAGWSAVPNHAIVVWVNGVMALPFVLRALLPAVYQYEKRYRRLYQSLGVRGWTRVLRDWPLLRRSVAQALGYAMLLSLGDMGVIALFGSQGLVSLPLYLYQLIGTYRLQEGASVAVLLVLLCALLFMACTRGIGGPAPKVGVGHA
jgi:thiamine transport system permease protein